MEHQNDYAIEVRNVSLTIKNTQILKAVSLAIPRGEICGLIGRNGSGKTMLMKCICGFVKPTSGQVAVEGKLVGEDMDFPEHMGILIETPGFIPYYSGYRNLKTLADLNHPLSKEQLQSYLQLVGLDPQQNKPVRTYSLGMRQRLGLAQALMEEPDILILDEPMNGLDKDGVAQMRELLLSLKEQGRTILIASHNTEDIETLCDSVWEMDKGHLEEVVRMNAVSV